MQTDIVICFILVELVKPFWLIEWHKIKFSSEQQIFYKLDIN